MSDADKKFWAGTYKDSIEFLKLRHSNSSMRTFLIAELTFACKTRTGVEI